MIVYCTSIWGAADIQKPHFICIQTSENIYWGFIRCSVWLCLVGTDALFGKTDGLFCTTDICNEVSNMHMCCIRFSNRFSYRPNRGLIGPTNLDKTCFVILWRKGKGVWGNRYLFETFQKYVFVFSLKTIHHGCLTKQGLCVAKQSFCIFQTEAHSCKERPLSSSNRASVWTKPGICICLVLLSVFFMRLCLNPGSVIHQAEWSSSEDSVNVSQGKSNVNIQSTPDEWAVRKVGGAPLFRQPLTKGSWAGHQNFSMSYMSI